MKSIPIPVSANPEQIENLVDQVLTTKAADTSTLENEIDKLIYELYELTDEEIAIVEGR